MDAAKATRLQAVLERGVGASIVVEPHSPGTRAGLRSYFAGLTPNQGPLFTIAPTGLRRHRVTLQFGKFAGPCIAQMQNADGERLSLARALVQQIAVGHGITFMPEQSVADWCITGPEFQIDIIVMDVAEPASDEAIAETAQAVMVPLMAAMAELIGYDEQESESEEYDEEGRVTQSTVIRRERSARSRLLCLSIHGHRCAVCGLEPGDRYGEAGNIIEVHHLEPVSILAQPRPYDPRTDLVPLCPNCHRAIHTRRPIPYTVAELKELLGGDH